MNEILELIRNSQIGQAKKQIADIARDGGGYTEIYCMVRNLELSNSELLRIIHLVAESADDEIEEISRKN